MSINDDAPHVPGAAPTGADAIRAERVGPHTLVIRIDRPHRRNAIDGPTARAIEATMDMYEDDDDLRCAILTGSAETFSSGQDLIAAAHGDIGTSPERGGFGVLTTPPSKPLIAAVEGHALAGGFELCLACDLIVASSSATFGLPEASRSLVAIGGSLFRLPKRMPYHLAMEMALTGVPWPAARLMELGVINRVTEPGRALAGALELSEAIISGGPMAVRATAQIVRRAHDWEDSEGWRNQMEFARPVMRSDDLQEGLRAFAEKRPPVWTGH